jgi:PAS domain S-box-containing protein
MGFLSDLSIQKKLRWIIMLTSSAALLLACTAFVVYELSGFRSSMTRELSSVADVIGANSVAALEFNDPTAGEETLKALDADSRIVAAMIYRADSSRFATYERSIDGRSEFLPEPYEPGSYLRDGSLLIFRPITARGKQVGTIYIQSDLGEMYTRLRRYAAIVVAVLIASLLVAFLLSSTLQRVISTPILHLAETASQVSADKDYSLRAIKKSRDELGLLVDRFNEMLRQIQEQDHALRESEERYRTLIEHQQEGVVVIGPGEQFAFANPAAHDILGVPEGSLVGRNLRDFTDSENFELARSQAAARPIIKKTTYDLEITRPDGETRVLLVTASPRFDNQGVFTGTFGVFRDITDRKQAERKIKSSLREKEVLLKEIHHRVKNNLQVISSLLYLQSKNITDQKALGIFKDSQNRVKSMALIHEKLYRSADLARVNFSEYIRSLTGFLMTSCGTGTGGIDLDITTDESELGIDTAIPCGLIINELVTNSMKYAFPGGRKGRIRVELRSREDNHIEIVIGDDGVGLPKHFELEKADTLGLRLVNTLVKQINGTVELDPGLGATFRIVFPDPTTAEEQVSCTNRA